MLIATWGYTLLFHLYITQAVVGCPLVYSNVINATLMLTFISRL